MKQVRNAFGNAQERLGEAKETVKDKATGPVTEKVDREMGLFIHKAVCGPFMFDPEVRRRLEKVERLERNGEREEALEASKALEGYLDLKIHQGSQKYQAKAKQVAGELNKLGDGTDRLQQWADDLGPRQLLEKLRSADPGDLYDGND